MGPGSRPSGFSAGEAEAFGFARSARSRPPNVNDDNEADTLRCSVSIPRPVDQVVDPDAILPTHTCFDDTVEILAGIAAYAPEELEKYALVHAICIFPEGGYTLRGRVAGELFAHAWVEKRSPTGTEVLQIGIWRGYRVSYGMPLAQLEKMLKPQRRWRYTAEELWRDTTLRTVPGPWEPEIRALSGAHVCGVDEVGP